MVNITDKPFRPIYTSHEFESLTEESFQAPVVVFKHSLTCHLSLSAIKKLSKTPSTLTDRINLIPVQTARPLSNEVEEKTGVRHESPQLLVLVNGEVVWNTSHHGVTVENLEQGLTQMQQTT